MFGVISAVAPILPVLCSSCASLMLINSQRAQAQLLLPLLPTFALHQNRCQQFPSVSPQRKFLLFLRILISWGHESFLELPTMSNVNSGCFLFLRGGTGVWELWLVIAF